MAVGSAGRVGVVVVVVAVVVVAVVVVAVVVVVRVVGLAGSVVVTTSVWEADNPAKATRMEKTIILSGRMRYGIDLTAGTPVRSEAL